MNILAIGLFIVAVAILLQVPKMRSLFTFLCCLALACSLGYAALVLVHIAPVLPVIQTLLARR
jgi:hypothetical protein